MPTNQMFCGWMVTGKHIHLIGIQQIFLHGCIMKGAILVYAINFFLLVLIFQKYCSLTVSSIIFLVLALLFNAIVSIILMLFIVKIIVIIYIYLFMH